MPPTQWCSTKARCIADASPDERERMLVADEAGPRKKRRRRRGRKKPEGAETPPPRTDMGPET